MTPMINRKLPTPSSACHIPIDAAIPTKPQTNERRLGLDLEIVTESISENRIDACSTSASGAPRNNTRRSVRTTSDPPLPCVVDVKRTDSPGRSSETLETTGVSSPAPESEIDPVSCACPEPMEESPPPAGETELSSFVVLSSSSSIAASGSVSRRSPSTVGVSEQVQNRTDSSTVPVPAPTSSVSRSNASGSVPAECSSEPAPST